MQGRGAWFHSSGGGGGLGWGTVRVPLTTLRREEPGRKALAQTALQGATWTYFISLHRVLGMKSGFYTRMMALSGFLGHTIHFKRERGTHSPSPSPRGSHPHHYAVCSAPMWCQALSLGPPPPALSHFPGPPVCPQCPGGLCGCAEELSSLSYVYRPPTPELSATRDSNRKVLGAVTHQLQVVPQVAVNSVRILKSVEVGLWRDKPVSTQLLPASPANHPAGRLGLPCTATAGLEYSPPGPP